MLILSSPDDRLGMINGLKVFSLSHHVYMSFVCFSSGNIPIEGRTVDGRERETESVTRKEDKKTQVRSKGEWTHRSLFILE